MQEVQSRANIKETSQRKCTIILTGFSFCSAISLKLQPTNTTELPRTGDISPCKQLESPVVPPLRCGSGGGGSGGVGGVMGGVPPDEGFAGGRGRGPPRLSGARDARHRVAWSGAAPGASAQLERWLSLPCCIGSCREAVVRLVHRWQPAAAPGPPVQCLIRRGASLCPCVTGRTLDE